MRLVFIVVLSIVFIDANTQTKQYTTANAHSHNDYEQPNPFWEAWNQGFGSIEADVFLVKSETRLLVAHTATDLKIKRRTLDSLYLLPLQQCLKKNRGTPYADTTKRLQILIDIKTEATPTLQKLVETIQQFPELTRCPQLQFVISGNRPSPDSFVFYPAFIQFDGELNQLYSDKALSRIVLMSDNLRRYTSWNGADDLPGQDKQKLLEKINESHGLGKPVRFWNAPDNEQAWLTLMALGVDYLNTDKINQLTKFLDESKHPRILW